MDKHAALHSYHAFLARAGCEHIFGFNGRINRARYWLYLGAAVCALVLLHAVHGFTTTSFSAVPNAVETHFSGALFALLGDLFSLLVVLAILFAGTALTVRRLHDRDKDGAWATLYLLVPVFLFELGQLLLDDHVEAVHSLPYLFQLVALIVLAWSFVELCCRRGSVGGNRFGAAPLQPKVDSPKGLPGSLAR
jgi:uncharacterized membrane protein YhaH (DUF805 family)